MLGDTPSRAPCASVNILEVLKIDLNDVMGGYEDDEFYAADSKCMKTEEISDEMMERRIENLFPLFHLEEWKLL